MTDRHRFRSSIASLGAALVIVPLTAAMALAAPGVTPSSVSATLVPGDSTTVTKTVETPPIPPNPDIVFLADITSSMSGAIGNVQSNAATIMSSVLAAQPSAQFAVAHYTDQLCPAYFGLDQPITADTTAVATALAGLTTPNLACNPDAAEDFINALYQLATDPAVGLRTGSTRIVVLFGDSSSHDPSAGISGASATSALQAAGIRVVAVNVPGTPGYSFDGLDHTGQATAIASATGGVFLNAPTVGEISDTILAGLGNLPVTVSPDVSCDPGLTVSITPASQTVTSGDSATWSETITVDPGNPGGVTLHCTVDWLIDGSLAGPEFVQQVAIDVPGADLVIVKTGPAIVTEGDGFTYELTVTNNGPANATDVVIVDPLPTNATFVSADSDCSESAGTVTCAIGALAAGDSATRSITVVAASAGSDLTNTASASAFQTDPDPTTNTSTVVTVLNHDPICTEVTAGDDLWPPNHKFVPRTLTGASDVDGDTLVTTVLGVTQDEPVDGMGDGRTSPDGRLGLASDQVELRAERSGIGDGRVYRISFQVEDGRGGECSGTVIVGVPHDQDGQPAIDSGDVYDAFLVATSPAAGSSVQHGATKVQHAATKTHQPRPTAGTSPEAARPSEIPDPAPTAPTDSTTTPGASDVPAKGGSDHGHRGKSGQAPGGAEHGVTSRAAGRAP